MTVTLIRPIKVTDSTVTLRRTDYERLLDAAEDRQDAEAFAAFDARVAEKGLAAVVDEMLPIDMALRIMDGENAVRVWREYRDLTQRRLAMAAGIGAGYLNDIEKGRKPGSADALAKLAKALRTSVEALLASSPG
jgi:DNA-binding XRE family transcriptional regulator